MRNIKIRVFQSYVIYFINPLQGTLTLKLRLKKNKNILL